MGKKTIGYNILKALNNNLTNDDDTDELANSAPDGGNEDISLESLNPAGNENAIGDNALEEFNYGDSSATRMPAARTKYNPSPVPVPESYLQDRQFRGVSDPLIDMAESRMPTDALFSPPPTMQPAQSNNESDIVDEIGFSPARNIPKDLQARAGEMGIDPNDKQYKTSRKRQALEGLLRSLQSLGDPNVAQMVGRGGLPALLGLLGSGAITGAAQKNILGQERLAVDTGRAQAEQSRKSELATKATDRRLKEAQVYDVTVGRNQRERDKRQSAERIANARNTMRMAEAEMKAKQVTSWKRVDDDEGNVWLVGADKSGKEIAVPVRNNKGEQLRSREAEEAEFRRDATMQRIELQRKNAETYSRSVDVRANPPTTTTTNETTKTPKRSLDTIARIKFGKDYKDLSKSKQATVDAAYNSPANYDTKSTSTKSTRSIQRPGSNTIRNSIKPDDKSTWLRAPDGTIIKSPEEYDEYKKRKRGK
jgi:hypothetical protein